MFLSLLSGLCHNSVTPSLNADRVGKCESDAIPTNLDATALVGVYIRCLSDAFIPYQNLYCSVFTNQPLDLYLLSNPQPWPLKL